MKPPPKTIPNPGYLKWRQERYERSNPFHYPDEDLHPEDHGKQLPEEGGWILLLMNVQVGRQLPDGGVKPIDIERLTAWYALPALIARSGLHQAVIQTPGGAVHVWPHEYQLFDVGKWLDFTPEDGLEIRFLGQGAGFDEQALFYLRSRGVGKALAQRMLLPQLKDPYCCWFRFSDGCREFFSEGTGTPYLMPHNRARRAKARRRAAEGRKQP